MEEFLCFSYKNIVILLLGAIIFPEASYSAAIGNRCSMNCSVEINSSAVCASNGVTFSSKCAFEEANCSNHWDLVIIYNTSCPEACAKDCSGEKTSKVCSSNVQTFQNQCEYRKQRCLQNANWEIIFENECATLAPPSSLSCREHQKMRRKKESYRDQRTRCKIDELDKKSQAGNLTFSDIEHCYDPLCRTLEYYSPHQCGSFYNNWCWCAKSDGTMIPGSYGSGVKKEDCELRQECLYQGVEYDDGENIFPKNICGKCKCLNGVVECAVKYNSSSLSDKQVAMLKSDLLQLFHYQSDLNNTKRIDVFHTDEHPQYISDAVARRILGNKFNHFDKDESRTISTNERHLLDIEVFSFIHCLDFRMQVYSLMDSNQDDQINLTEWGEFFGIEHLIRKKRSLTNRTILQKLRRKIQYLLV